MTTSKPYDDAAWKALRQQVLEESPYCGCGEPATEVDHIISVRKRPDLRLERANLQSMCGRCHKRKTYYADGALGFNPDRDKIKGADESGIPIDHKHHWNAS